MLAYNEISTVVVRFEQRKRVQLYYFQYERAADGAFSALARPRLLLEDTTTSKTPLLFLNIGGGCVLLRQSSAATEELSFEVLDLYELTVKRYQLRLENEKVVQFNVHCLLAGVFWIYFLRLGRIPMQLVFDAAQQRFDAFPLEAESLNTSFSIQDIIYDRRLNYLFLRIHQVENFLAFTKILSIDVAQSRMTSLLAMRDEFRSIVQHRDDSVWGSRFLQKLPEQETTHHFVHLKLISLAVSLYDVKLELLQQLRAQKLNQRYNHYMLQSILNIMLNGLQDREDVV